MPESTGMMLKSIILFRCPVLGTCLRVSFLAYLLLLMLILRCGFASEKAAAAGLFTVRRRWISPERGLWFAWTTRAPVRIWLPLSRRSLSRRSFSGSSERLLFISISATIVNLPTRRWLGLVLFGFTCVFRQKISCVVGKPTFQKRRGREKRLIRLASCQPLHPVLNIKQFLAFMPERTLDLGHVRFVTALSLMHNNNVFASNSSAHRCTAKVHRLGQPDLHCFYDESFNTDSKTTIQGH